MLHRENRILANLWNIFVLITSKNHACYLPHVFPIEYPHHHQMNTLLNAMIPYLLLINFNLYLWKYFWVKPIHYYNLRLHHWNCTNSWRNRWYIKTRMFWVAGDTIAMTGIFFNESKKKNVSVDPRDGNWETSHFSLCCPTFHMRRAQPRTGKP